jgi:hypothetical protein
MRSILPSHKPAVYESLLWCESQTTAGVRYAIRRVSLGHRLELAKQARELSLRNEFLQSGNASEQLEASLSDLLVARLYLEWGLAEINGLKIDGEPATPVLLIEKGPEPLANEILASIHAEIGISEDERKNF